MVLPPHIARNNFGFGCFLIDNFLIFVTALNINYKFKNLQL